jgi:hypothetical protein
MLSKILILACPQRTGWQPSMLPSMHSWPTAHRRTRSRTSGKLRRRRRSSRICCVSVCSVEWRRRIGRLNAKRCDSCIYTLGSTWRSGRSTRLGDDRRARDLGPLSPSATISQAHSIEDQHEVFVCIITMLNTVSCHALCHTLYRSADHLLRMLFGMRNDTSRVKDSAMIHWPLPCDFVGPSLACSA